jgi:hypothetical protein
MVRVWVVLVFGVVSVHLLDDLDIQWITSGRPSAIIVFHHLDISKSVAGRGINPTYYLVIFVCLSHLESSFEVLAKKFFTEETRRRKFNAE